MSNEQTPYEQWIPVIARSLAYLCVHVGELKEKNLADKAGFLESMGLERKDAARLLGTTSASITETLSRAKRAKKEKKRANRGGKKGGRKSKARKAR